MDVIIDLRHRTTGFHFLFSHIF